MRKPSECITDNKRKRDIKVSADPQKPDKQADSESGAEEMQIPGHRTAVFRNIVVPKLRVFGYSLLIVFHFFRLRQRQKLFETYLVHSLDLKTYRFRFQLSAGFFLIVHSYVFRPSEFFKDTDRDPVQVKLIPFDAVPGRRW